MQVTKATFRKFEKGMMQGFSEVTIDDQLKITGITVFKKGQDVWFNMPSKKKGDEYFDIVYCLEPTLREEMLEAIKEQMGVVESVSNRSEPEDPDLSGLPF